MWVPPPDTVAWVTAIDPAAQPDCDVVVLDGDLDIERAGQIIDLLVRSTARPRVVADLSGVGFLDSSGLRALLEAREALEAQGRSLELRDPSTRVTRLLELTATSSLFGVDGADPI
jgi:anti-anti-sigma factor